jgi:hypothetical protein
MVIKITAALALLVFACSTSVYAKENDYSIRYDSKTNSTIFVFKSDRGDVYFNHGKHQSNMGNESCIPCHKTSSPTKEITLTRLDQRKAHYFCKGCHHNKGRGPTECHECHKLIKQ